MKRIILNPILFRNEHNATQDEYKKLFAILLNKEQADFIDYGIYVVDYNTIQVEIELTHAILKRQRKNSKNISGLRIEVLENNNFDYGAFGRIFRSLGTLIPEEAFAFKEPKPGKSRICKIVQMQPELSKIDDSLIEYNKSMVNSEAYFLSKNEDLHSKPAVFFLEKGFLVMRQFNDGDLSDYMNNQSLWHKLHLNHLIIQAGQEQLEKRNILHADLKPNNILIQKVGFDYKIVIIDFGFAVNIGEPLAPMDGDLIIYNAPERASSNIQTLIHSDRYSLGVILADVWLTQNTTYKAGDTEVFVQSVTSYYKSPEKSTTIFKPIYDLEVPFAIQKELIKLFIGLLSPDPLTRMSLDEALRIANAIKKMDNEYFLSDLIKQYRTYGSGSINCKDLLMQTYNIINALKTEFHDKNIIHGNLQPVHITIRQLSKTEYRTIIDSSSAFTADNLYIQETNNWLAYAALECKGTKQRPTRESDRYSLGLILARLWGDQYLDSIQKNTGNNEMRTFINLFYNLKLDDSTKKGLIDIFTGLLEEKPEDRISLEDSLARLTDLINNFTPIADTPEIKRITINPTLFRAEETIEKKAFEKLLTLVREEEYISAGVYLDEIDGIKEELILTHSIIKEPSERNSQEYRIDILSESVWVNGSTSTFRMILGEIHSKEKYVFKECAQNEARLCKFIPFQSQEGVQLHSKNTILSAYELIREEFDAKKPVFTHSGAFIVMKYFTNYSLKELTSMLNQGQLQLTAEQRLQYTYDMIKALKEQIRDNELIHLNLKPEKILFTTNPVENSGKYKIEILNSLLTINQNNTMQNNMEDDSTPISYGKGLAAYTAPEIWLSDEMPLNADIYSLGMILAEFWGDKSLKEVGTDTLELGVFHTQNRRFVGLFDNIPMTQEIKSELTYILNGFLEPYPSARLSIENALIILETLLQGKSDKKTDSLMEFTIRFDPTKSICSSKAGYAEEVLITIINHFLKLESGDFIEKGKYKYAMQDFIKNSDLNGLEVCIADEDYDGHELFTADIPHMVVNVIMAQSLLRTNKGEYTYEVLSNDLYQNEFSDYCAILGQVSINNNITFEAIQRDTQRLCKIFANNPIHQAGQEVYFAKSNKKLRVEEPVFAKRNNFLQGFVVIELPGNLITLSNLINDMDAKRATQTAKWLWELRQSMIKVSLNDALKIMTAPISKENQPRFQFFKSGQNNNKRIKIDVSDNSDNTNTPHLGHAEGD